MDLARELQAIEPLARPSPLPGFEYVRGWGVMAAPFDSGHVLALRVFPENDFAPYRTIWHRTPHGEWSIYADAPRLDIACPRYYGAATRHTARCRLSLRWTGPMTLSVAMDAPRLQWNVSLTSTPLVRMMNAVSGRMPERLWRSSVMLRTFERIGGALFGLGKVTLSGTAPNGQLTVLMPRRMFPVAAMAARLEGEDLGRPARGGENPAIGELLLPARATLAVGRAYFEIRDPEEHRRTVAEVGSATA